VLIGRTGRNVIYTAVSMGAGGDRKKRDGRYHRGYLVSKWGGGGADEGGGVWGGGGGGGGGGGRGSGVRWGGWE